MNLPDSLYKVAQDSKHPLLFATISGAHLYGFASADSDYDIRGVHILPVEQLLGLHQPEETIELSAHPAVGDAYELDFVTHDIKKFILLLLKKNGYVLEQLLSPLILHTSDEHEELKVIAQSCITKHHAYHYLGFSRTQWDLFQKESPPQVKPLLYVFRVLLTGIHLMKTGRIEANLKTLNTEYKLPYIDELVQQKIEGQEKELLRETAITFYQDEYNQLVTELEQASAESRLPESPSAKEQLHSLLLRLRGVVNH